MSFSSQFLLVVFHWSQWQWISFDLQDFSRYSSRSWQCSCLNGSILPLIPSSYNLYYYYYNCCYGCTTWTLTKRLEKKLDGNYTRMLRAILNKSWRQHPTKHQLYNHVSPITKIIQVRQTRHSGHCWRSRDELIREVLLWTPAYGQAKAGRPARTYTQQLCEDTGCSTEDLPRTMNDRDIRAVRMTWWWWSLQ